MTLENKTPPMLDINQLSKWFAQFQVLNKIDLKVVGQEKIVICGPSGSGKSTLLRCINGLEPFQEGTIDVDGIRITDSTKILNQIRQKVGMVFQQFNLFNHLTILENLTLAPMLVKN